MQELVRNAKTSRAKVENLTDAALPPLSSSFSDKKSVLLACWIYCITHCTSSAVTITLDLATNELEKERK
jgi:hypothetical protein